MIVDVIEDHARFAEVRPAWDDLYAGDANATVFLSWSWLSAFLRLEREPWTILGVRVGARYCAFLPLARSAFPAVGPRLGIELKLAANPTADYAGLLADPTFECEAIEHLANHVLAMRWDVFYLCDVLDQRLLRLADLIAANDVARRQLAFPTVCLYRDLPADFDSLVQTLSFNVRRNLRKGMRRLEAVADVRAERVDATAIDAAIDHLLTLRQRQWHGHTARDRHIYRSLFRNCFDAGCLRMYAVWSADRPLVLLAAFVDDQNRAFSAYMMAYDRGFARLSLGKTMIAYAMREAIAEHCRIFDFLRGDHPYKAAFASGQRTTTHQALIRETFRGRTVFAARALYEQAKNIARRVPEVPHL